MPKIRHRSVVGDGKQPSQVTDHRDAGNYHNAQYAAHSYDTISSRGISQDRSWEGESEVSELSDLTELSDDETTVSYMNVDHPIGGNTRTEYESRYSSGGESEIYEPDSEEETVVPGDIEAYWTRKKRASPREERFIVPMDETSFAPRTPTYTLHKVETFSEPKIKACTVPTKEVKLDIQNASSTQAAHVHPTTDVRMVYYTFPTSRLKQRNDEPIKKSNLDPNKETHSVPDDVTLKKEGVGTDARKAAATEEEESPNPPALEGNGLPRLVADSRYLPVIKALREKAVACRKTAMEKWDKSKMPNDDCEDCVATIGYRATKQGLRRHIMTHYPDGSFCPVCDRVFAREDSLDRHLTSLPTSCLDKPKAQEFLLWRTANNKVGRLLERRYTTTYFLGAMEDFQMRDDHFNIVAIRKRHHPIILHRGKPPRDLKRLPDSILRFLGTYDEVQSGIVVTTTKYLDNETEEDTDADSKE